MREIPYRRADAVRYAEHWAMGRNPAYYDFDGLGGDCTNFISQCVYAGAGVMNYTPNTGWYYESLNRRAPAWTGVDEFYRFIVNNRGPGPYGRVIPRSAVQPGDVIQLGSSGGGFYHSLLVLGVDGGKVYVAAHTFDALWRPLDSYSHDLERVIHIVDIRTS